MAYIIGIAASLIAFTVGYFQGKRLENQSWQRYLGSLTPELKKALIKGLRGKPN